jgi:pimeloyl-ACP methyl ester carboxylesterase
MSTKAQTTFIQTNIGKIAIYKTDRTSDKLPVILLHGVYFDHHLWDEQVKQINDRTVVTIDMPFHGESREITKPDWSLNDCADMLIEILDRLYVQKVIAVGHSWGSMTILRAANKQPEKFSSIVLCNMPFLTASNKNKLIIRLQHAILLFRKFYTKQAAKALFGKTSLKQNPKFIETLKRPMSILSNMQIKQTDKAVIINAEDATRLINNLNVRTIAIKGKEDYVPRPTNIKTIEIEGGHISPLEKPTIVLNVIKDFIK